MKTIYNITSKGQITLPVSWRKKSDVKQISIAENSDGSLLLSPVRVNQEQYIFDAVRDNNGKGLKASELLKTLQRINKK